MNIEFFWVFFGGLSDVFITGTLLFVTDESNKATVYIDPNTNQPYAVLDVIKRNSISRLSINDQNDESENVQSEMESLSGSVLVSDRMIAQFFTKSVLDYD